VNHYPFNPSDYMMATAHLEPLADLCYRRCLDLYYDSEAPLMLCKRTLSKRLRVNEDVLSEVLAEFFLELQDGFHHKRCDEEIERFRAKSQKAKAAGSLGGQRKQANAKRTLTKRLASASNQNQNQNQNQEPKEKKHTLAKPDVTEVVAYCQDIDLPAADGVAVFDKWTGSGWKNGGQAIKDWKATIRAWKAQGYMPSQKRGSSAYGRPQATHNGRPPSCL